MYCPLTCRNFNPEDQFDQFNIDLHGITPGRVDQSPTWNQLYLDLVDKVQGAIVFSHSNFDPQAVTAANIKYGLGSIDVTWNDSITIAKAA